MFVCSTAQTIILPPRYRQKVQAESPAVRPSGGVSMTIRQVAKGQPQSDDLAGAITNAMRGMPELRDENATLRAHNGELEHRRSVLESEIATLRAQLDNERNERRHYHSL